MAYDDTGLRRRRWPIFLALVLVVVGAGDHLLHERQAEQEPDVEPLVHATVASGDRPGSRTAAVPGRPENDPPG